MKKCVQKLKRGQNWCAEEIEAFAAVPPKNIKEKRIFRIKWYLVIGPLVVNICRAAVGAEQEIGCTLIRMVAYMTEIIVMKDEERQLFVLVDSMLEN